MEGERKQREGGWAGCDGLTVEPKTQPLEQALALQDAFVRHRHAASRNARRQ